MKITRLLFCLLLMTALVACASKKEAQEQEEQDEITKEEKTAEAVKAADTYKPHLICPQVAIIHELEVVKDYGGEKPAADQLVSGSRMKSVSGSCSYQDEGIDIAFSINFAAAKGPRLGGNQANFPFFVAVLDPDQSILNKNQMSVDFKFSGDDKIATLSDPLHVFIPLPKDKNTVGPNYRVLTGFQLTEEQLKDVRKSEEKR